MKLFGILSVVVLSLAASTQAFLFPPAPAPPPMPCCCPPPPPPPCGGGCVGNPRFNSSFSPEVSFVFRNSVKASRLLANTILNAFGETAEEKT
ncbi:hypothetical protein Ddc_13431 [Ditylenchus destructor]|nr:hypothetical protein Ddc_13431 [Ditylenchus destructor]